MALPASTQGDVSRAIRAHDQHTAASQASSQVKKQADRAAIRPLQIIECQQERSPAGDRAHHAGVLLEEGVLVQVRAGRETCLALHKLLQPRQPVRPAGPRCIGRGPLREGRPRHEGVNQIRAGFHQGLRRERQGVPQTAGLLAAERLCGPPLLDLTAQQAQDLAERHVGVALAGVGIPVASRNDQLGVGGLGPPGKLLHQGRLALARISGHENNPGLAAQRQVEESVQARQLVLAGDEHRPARFCGCVFLRCYLQERGKLRGGQGLQVHQLLVLPAGSRGRARRPTPPEAPRRRSGRRAGRRRGPR